MTKTTNNSYEELRKAQEFLQTLEPDPRILELATKVEMLRVNIDSSNVIHKPIALKAIAFLSGSFVKADELLTVISMIIGFIQKSEGVIEAYNDWRSPES